jgi:hypothetical protein
MAGGDQIAIDGIEVNGASAGDFLPNRFADQDTSLDPEKA